MNFKPALAFGVHLSVAVIALVAALSTPARADDFGMEDPGYDSMPGFIQLTTAEGCLYWSSFSDIPWGNTTTGKAYLWTVTFSPGCTPGRLISGKGKFTITGSKDDYFEENRGLAYTLEGTLIDGYFDGPVVDVTDGKSETAVLHMGCKEGEEARCGPGTPNAYQPKAEPDQVATAEPEAEPATAPPSPEAAPATSPGTANPQVQTVLQLGPTCITARVVENKPFGDKQIVTTIELKNGCATAQIVASYIGTSGNGGPTGTELFVPSGPQYLAWPKDMPKLPFTAGNPDFTAVTMGAGVSATADFIQMTEGAQNYIFKSAACEFQDAKGHQNTLFRDVTFDGFTQAVCIPRP